MTVDKKYYQVVNWIKLNLFNSPLNSLITIIIIFSLIKIGPYLLSWFILDAVWIAEMPSLCHTASGACWAVIAEKHRPILFGVYPFDEHWRLVVAILVYLISVGVTLYPKFWQRKLLIPLWIFTISSTLTLMWGGVFGLPYVDSSQWGGLPLTLMLFTGTIVLGFPLAVLLALGRRSHLPGIKVVCVTFIECVRGVPLVTILFVVVNIFPLFMPQGAEIDKLLRVMVGLAVFSACYQAEVVRGGLQAVPPGQYEAAKSLGLNYWHMTFYIILPWALRVSLPGIVNHIIAAFKNTSFVIIIGLFDILTATSAVMEDPLWRQFYIETYLFVAAIYFCFCFALSKYSQNMEKRLLLKH